MDNRKLAHKFNRDRFSDYYNMLQNTLDIVGFEAEIEPKAVAW